MNDPANSGAMSGEATLTFEGQPAEMHLYQLIGRIWLVEFNAERAADISNLSHQQWFAENALLSAYAALEALISETVLFLLPEMYEDRRWRRSGLIEKFRSYLDATGRQDEQIPGEISEISEHRIAMTHSEPDNDRTSRMNKFILDGNCIALGRVVRSLCMWLWREDIPGVFQQGWTLPRPNVAVDFSEPTQGQQAIRSE